MKDRMDKVQRRIVAIAESAAEEAEQVERDQRRYEETIDKLRSELQVLNDVTIPGLVAANKMTLAELDSWTAIHARRQALALPNEED